MVDFFGDGFGNPWESLLVGPVQDWLAQHPLLGWLVGHPLWALGMALAGLLLFAGLWSAIARLTEGFWLALVGLPLRLSTWIFASLSRLLVRRWAKPPALAESSNRLDEILGRLGTLQTEQEKLLEEMRQILQQQVKGKGD
jgi:hypothetical protein